MLPPTPRQIALAWLAIRLYPLNEDASPRYPYSATFTVGVLELIVGEIVEVTISDCRSLFNSLHTLISKERRRLEAASKLDEAEELGHWATDFSEAFTDIGEGCALLDSLEHQIRDRVTDKQAEEDLADVSEPIERRSPLGLFLRRTSLALRRLDLAGTALLARQIGAWCGHSTSTVPLGVHPADESGMQRELAFKRYRKAMSENDFYGAKEALRRFGDYALHTPHGQHHHVLLNRAATLLDEDAYSLAQATVEEAIRIARSRGDRPCLDHCMRVQKQIAAAAAKKREREKHPDDPPEGFPKYVSVSDMLKESAAALPTAQSPIVTPIGQPLAQWHLEQARLWHELGSTPLSLIHRQMAQDHADVEYDPYIDTLLLDCQELARHADYDTALSKLTTVDISRMDMQAYHRWADTVNAILRKRDDKNHMLPESNSGESFLTLARDVVELIAAGYNVPSVLERAILAYEVARRDQHWDDYASASVVVAYCLVRMEMAPRALEMIGEVWDTVLRIDDADTVALGEMIMAKIRMEEAFKLDEADYPVIEGEIVKARDLAERARWSRLYDEGEQALSAIAKKQGRERTVASLPKYDNISDIWRVAILVGRKVIGMDP